MVDNDTPLKKPHQVRLYAQFFWFAFVGVIGFVVDAGMLSGLVKGFEINPYIARCGSFLAAATTTWILNRRLTFRSSQRISAREWGSYALFMGLGAIINLSVFSTTIHYLGASQSTLLAGVVLGTGSAMLLNFFTARHVLVRDSSTSI